jgi:hypothetical protein
MISFTEKQKQVNHNASLLAYPRQLWQTDSREDPEGRKGKGNEKGARKDPQCSEGYHSIFPM